MLSIAVYLTQNLECGLQKILDLNLGNHTNLLIVVIGSKYASLWGNEAELFEIQITMRQSS